MPTHNNNTTITIHYSIAKILIGLLKPLILIFIAILLIINVSFTEYYQNLIIQTIAMIIIAIASYQILTALYCISQTKKKFLSLDKHKLTVYSSNAAEFSIRWQDIKQIITLTVLDKFVLETDLILTPQKATKYQIINVTKSVDKNNPHANLVLSAKYLDFHFKELESLLKRLIPDSTEEN